MAIDIRYSRAATVMLSEKQAEQTIHGNTGVHCTGDRPYRHSFSGGGGGGGATVYDDIDGLGGTVHVIISSQVGGSLLWVTNYCMTEPLFTKHSTILCFNNAPVKL